MIDDPQEDVTKLTVSPTAIKSDTRPPVITQNLREIMGEGLVELNQK